MYPSASVLIDIVFGYRGKELILASLSDQKNLVLGAYSYKVESFKFV